MDGIHLPDPRSANRVVHPFGLGPYLTQRGNRGVLMPSWATTIGGMVGGLVIIVCSSHTEESH